MATAASRVRVIPSPTPENSRIASLGWDNVNWSVSRAEKLPGIICDAALFLVNGLALTLLFGHTLNPGMQVLNAKTAWLPGSSLLHHLGGLVGYAGLTALACASVNLYDPRKSLHGLSRCALVTPVALATVLFGVLLYSLDVSTGYWVLVAAMAVLDVVAMASWRGLQQRRIALLRTKEARCRRTLIIGAGESGQQLARYLDRHAVLGYTVKGFLDDCNESQAVTILGPVSAFWQVIRSEFIDEVFLTDTVSPEIIQRLSEEAQACGVDVKLVPGICQDAISWQCVGDLPVMVIRSEPIPKLGLFLKRTVDAMVAGLGLIVASPLLLFIAALIRLDSQGPGLYNSWRVGKKGVRFQCYKFRTMSVNADAAKDALRVKNERKGPTFKVNDDPRITRVGKWLRKYSLDELPQLWNVLRGEMSLVGPRPHPLDDYSQYELEHRLRLRVTPGLTGLWQVTARLDPSFERNMALDMEYIRNWTFRLDLNILMRTIPALIRGEGR